MSAAATLKPIATREGVLSAIGHTALIELTRFLPGAGFRIFGKLEGLNPGGSTKDRPALSILQHAIDTGEISEGTVVIESSSGNMGIGLAQACRYYGLRFICVIDPKITTQNKRLLHAYGAEVELVSEPDPVTGEFLKARLDRVRELLGSIRNSFWPGQYRNPYNPRAHHTTMREIVEALGWKLDYLFCATSTCGTVRGCAEFVRAEHLGCKIIAVDAVGSVIFGQPSSCRLLPGHGASVRPDLYRPDIADRCVWVSDQECVVACRRLALREALLVGGSSGAVAAALERSRDEIPPGSTCALIFADRGERYLDTVYSDAWVASHFGDISHLWTEERPAYAPGFGSERVGNVRSRPVNSLA